MSDTEREQDLAAYWRDNRLPWNAQIDRTWGDAYRAGHDAATARAAKRIALKDRKENDLLDALASETDRAEAAEARVAELERQVANRAQRYTEHDTEAVLESVSAILGEYERRDGDEHVNEHVEQIITAVWGQKEGDTARRRYAQPLLARAEAAERALAAAQERIEQLRRLAESHKAEATTAMGRELKAVEALTDVMKLKMDLAQARVDAGHYRDQCSDARERAEAAEAREAALRAAVEKARKALSST